MVASLRPPVWLLLLAPLFFAHGQDGWAQGSSAGNHQTILTAQIRLGPTAQTFAVPFTVDDASSIEVEVVAPCDGSCSSRGRVQR